MPFRKHHYRPQRLWQNVAIAPFQVPLMVYLFTTGILFTFQARTLSAELDIPVWSLYNFTLSLIAGAGITLVGRLKSNERLEAFGLGFVVVAVAIAIVLSFAIGDQLGIGDELFIGTGCILRMRVLSKAREAERVAIKLIDSGKADLNVSITKPDNKEA